MSETGDSTPSSLPETQTPKGFTLNVAGLPIPLRRTFSALDRLFALPIEAIGDALEKKMKGNLDSHVDAVRKKRRNKAKKETIENPSIKTAKALAAWAAGAAEVGPDEQELSAVWRALLDAIMEEKDEADALLRIVRDARSADIRFFILRFANRTDPLARYGDVAFTGYGDMDRLRAIGLVTRPFGLNYVGGIALFMGVAFFELVKYAPLPLVGGPGLTPSGQLLRILADSAVPMAAVTAIFLLFVFQMHRPTLLGRRLCKLYGEYASANNRKQAETAAS